MHEEIITKSYWKNLKRLVKSRHFQFKYEYQTNNSQFKLVKTIDLVNKYTV